MTSSPEILALSLCSLPRCFRQISQSIGPIPPRQGYIRHLYERNSMPRRHHSRLGSRHPLPVSVSQLLIKQALLLAIAVFAYSRIPQSLRHTSLGHLQQAIRIFLAWFLPLTAAVHTAWALLHEGPPLMGTIRSRTTALAISWPLGVVLFFWAATMCGASVSSQGWNTLHFAAFMSSLVIAPMAAAVGTEGRRWQYVFAHWQPSGTDELSAAIPGYAAIVGSWLGAFPTPLDWGTEWQEWPVCSTFAAGISYSLGLVASPVIAWHMRKSQQAVPTTQTAQERFHAAGT